MCIRSPGLFGWRLPGRSFLLLSTTAISIHERPPSSTIVGTTVVTPYSSNERTFASAITPVAMRSAPATTSVPCGHICHAPYHATEIQKPKQKAQSRKSCHVSESCFFRYPRGVSRMSSAERSWNDLQAPPTSNATVHQSGTFTFCRRHTLTASVASAHRNDSAENPLQGRQIGLQLYQIKSVDALPVGADLLSRERDPGLIVVRLVEAARHLLAPAPGDAGSASGRVA